MKSARRNETKKKKNNKFTLNDVSGELLRAHLLMQVGVCMATFAFDTKIMCM